MILRVYVNLPEGTSDRMSDRMSESEHIPNKMPNRIPDGMSKYVCQKECQIEYQNICQIKCRTRICHIPDMCQIEYHRISVGGDHSKKALISVLNTYVCSFSRLYFFYLFLFLSFFLFFSFLSVCLSFFLPLPESSFV